MTKLPTLRSTEDIKRLVTSPATCDGSVADALRAHLGQEATLTKQTPTPRTQPNKIGSKQRSNARGATTVRAAKAPKATTCGGESHPSHRLPTSEQLALATLVINETLKGLTQAAKEELSLDKAGISTVTNPKHALTRGQSNKEKKQSPLRPISGNRVVKTSKNDNGKLQRTCGVLSKNNGTEAQACCALIAFESLGRLQKASLEKFDPPYLQLEKGLSALVQKCIALRLYDIGLKAIRLLRKRLLELADCASDLGPKLNKTVSSVRETDSDIETTSIVDLISHGKLPAGSPALPLVTVSQCQILRIIASGGTRNLHQLTELVDPSNPLSPAATILRQVDHSNYLSKEKASHDLEILAQLLLKVAERSKTLEQSLQDVSRSFGGQILRLNIIALRTRSEWWKLSGHVINESTDLWRPFCRSLDIYQECASRSGENQNLEIKGALEIVQTLLPSARPSARTIPFFVLQKLSDVVRGAGHDQSASEWLQSAYDSNISHQSAAFQCLRICQSTKLHLDQILRDTGTSIDTDLLEQAVEKLSADIRGPAEELDELLVVASSLRKSASLYFIAMKRKKLVNTSPASFEIDASCLRLVKSCVHFYVRYLGTLPGQNFDDGDGAPYAMRLRRIRSVLAPAIDQLCALTKTPGVLTTTTWIEIKSTSLDCFKLFQVVRGNSFPTPPSDKRHELNSNMVTAMASIFWQSYERLKLEVIDTREAHFCAETAIEILQGTDTQTQLNCSLHIKLEHYIRKLEATNQLRRAFDVCQQALAMCRQSDLPEATLTVPSVFAGHSEANVHATLLRKYLRLSAKLSDADTDTKLFYDPEDFDERPRMVTLMIQFCNLCALLSSTSQFSRYSKSLHSILPKLLEICSEEHFPFRRLYIRTQLMMLNIHMPGAFDFPSQEQPDNRQASEQLALSKESDLQCYWRNSAQRRDLMLALQNTNPDTNLIDQIIKDWIATIQNCPDSQKLRTMVYDVDSWRVQIRLLGDFFLHRQCPSMHVYCLTLNQLLAEKLGASSDEKLNIGSQIGLQYGLLGHATDGLNIVQKAGLSYSMELISPMTRFEWSATMSELSLLSGNLDKCSDHMSTACRLLSELDRAQIDSISLYRKTAALFLLKSRLAFEHGHMYETLTYARVSIKTYTRVWASIVHRQRHSTPEKAGVDTDHEGGPLSICNESTLDQSELSTKDLYKGSAVWATLSSFINALIHLSDMYLHAGNAPDSHYYLGKAESVAATADSPDHLEQCQAARAQYSFVAGANSSIQDVTNWSKMTANSNQPDLRAMNACCSMASLSSRLRGLEQSADLLTRAEHMIAQLKDKKPPNGLAVATTNGSLETSLSLLNISDNTAASENVAQKRLNNRTRVTKDHRKPNVERPKSVNHVELKVDQPDSIALIETQISLQRAQNHILSGDLSTAQTMLEDLAKVSLSSKASLHRLRLLGEAQMLLALNEMAVHPVFNVIPESILCHPSTCSSVPKDQKTNAEARPVRGKARHHLARSEVNNEDTKTYTTAHAFCALLHSARTNTQDTLRAASKLSSTIEYHHIMQIFSKSLLTLTILPSLHSSQPVTSTSVTFANDLSRSSARRTALIAMQVEKDLPTSSKPEAYLSETHQLAQPKADSMGLETMSFSDLESGFIETIPQSWNVVTVSINDTKDELLLSRLCAGEAPFVLNIPLERHSAVEIDEMPFGYTEVIEELQEIIQEANTSSHDSRNQASKADKTAWWDLRMELDARLRDLLQNIELIWFGGFRGIFSTQKPDTDSLAKLHQSLQAGLDKHLPSRQLTGNAKDIQRPSLHAHVVQLFVALGCPSPDNDIDELVLELLYLVVDILQFKGERNAYDEIDFDALVVDTLDALRQYHAWQVKRAEEQQQQQHVVLILDKSLHSIPWESLPCLKSTSVSRLPSLLCLRQRLLQQESQAQVKGYFEANRESGAFILNPSGDLSNTQRRFEDSLQSLPCWEGVTQRNPSEAEFQKLLADQEIFLYFGHGSGGQYIRSRTIKKLDRCAVALLMGCSSGMLTEAGQLEPYGTPFDYMMAGSPALVANLWDVTDKDIDRFTQSVLEKWGLFKQGSMPGLDSPVKKGRRQKGKMRVVRDIAVEPDVDTGPVSLDTAVARSRDKCILRYLNGAAPVVYGVPVLLGGKPT